MFQPAKWQRLEIRSIRSRNRSLTRKQRPVLTASIGCVRRRLSRMTRKDNEGTNGDGTRDQGALSFQRSTLRSLWRPLSRRPGAAALRSSDARLSFQRHSGERLGQSHPGPQYGPPCIVHRNHRCVWPERICLHGVVGRRPDERKGHSEIWRGFVLPRVPDHVSDVAAVRCARSLRSAIQGMGNAGRRVSQRCQTGRLTALTKQSSDAEFRYKCTTAVRSALPGSFQISRSTTNSIPVTAVLNGRPSMLRPETRSPTAVPAALIATTVSQ
jgi:hypothetical protein